MKRVIRNRKRLWMILALLASASHARAVELHIHPVPSLPVDFDPALADDVFSISAVSQIHRALFQIDSDSNPLPMLVGSFSVSRDQLDYVFDLRDIAFHNGKPLRSDDAKFSIERVVAKKVSGYERLGAIAGFRDFVEHKASGIAGITTPTQRRLKVHLSKPFPALIEILADSRFSILSKDSDTVSIGLGPYVLKHTDKDSALLERRHDAPQGPALVRYVRLTQADAIKAFERGEAHDLFAYSLRTPEVDRVAPKAVVQLIQAPRTYLMALNPRLATTQTERDFILAHVNVPKLIRACYPENTPTASIVPPGFFGYLPEPFDTAKHSVQARSNPRIETLRVVIAHGVDSEECVRKRLLEDLAPIAKHLSIEVVDTSVANARWQNNTTELIFIYLEGENTLDMLQFFNPNIHHLSFGVPGDRWIVSHLASYNLSDEPAAKQRKAEALSRHSLALKTVLPLFHPKQYIVYSSKYKPMKIGVRSSTFIDFTSLKESSR